MTGLISLRLLNKFPGTRWLGTTEMDFLTAREAGSLKPRWWQGYAPSEGSGGPSLLPSSSCWWLRCSLAFDCFSPGSASVSTLETCSHCCCCSVTQLCLTLRPHGMQHARLPCPPLSPGACSNSCPLTRGCHPTILSCRPLLLLPSVFPSIRFFSNELTLCIRWQSIGSSASASVLPMNIQG